jgi:hypothetical protein
LVRVRKMEEEKGDGLIASKHNHAEPLLEQKTKAERRETAPKTIQRNA